MHHSPSTIAAATRKVESGALRARDSRCERLERSVEEAALALQRDSTSTAHTISAPKDASGGALPAVDQVAKIMHFPTPPEASPTTMLHPEQEWEGYVVEINDTHFIVRLIDLTAAQRHEEEEATVPLTELSEHDRERIVVGSYLRWVIGYEVEVSTGNRTNASRIIIRDLPAFTAADLRAGEAWAGEVMRAWQR